MKLINKKSIYLLSLFVICLLTVVIVPTYAKFISGYVTDDAIVQFSLDFNVEITDIEEYEKFIVPAGATYDFNIKLTNASSSDVVYYGIWYRMVDPSEKTNDILIGKVNGTDVSTTGSIDALGDTTVTIAIMNNTLDDITVDIGVGSSNAANSIEYLDGKHLVNDEIVVPKDISISSIKINNVTSDSLPTSGLYDMTYTCTKGSQLEWDTYSKSITYKSGSYIKDNCSLNFTTSTTKKYLNEMPVGSYVAYTGDSNNGCDNTTTVNGLTACSGKNANATTTDMGYCESSSYKFYVQGWRIAYIDKTTNKVAIISAGSPECNSRTESTANETYIQTANALALKYCNSDYVDGDCTCTGGNGLCTIPSSDAWAINDDTFNKITEQATGVTGGGYLFNNIEGATKCGGVSSMKVCGYNNDLIDNGGYYCFASQYSSSDPYGVIWNPYYRSVIYSTTPSAYGLRPVISLSSSVFVTGGKGTSDDPYTIGK